MKTTSLVFPILLLTGLGTGGYYLWLPRSVAELNKLEEVVAAMAPVYERVKGHAGGQALPQMFELQVRHVASLNRVLEEGRGDCQGTTTALRELQERFLLETQRLGRQVGVTVQQLVAGGEAGAQRIVAGFVARFYPELKRLAPLLRGFGDSCPEAADVIRLLVSGVER